MSGRMTGLTVRFAAVLSTGLACAAGPAPPDAASVADITKDWPKPSQAAAQEMLRAYGPPAEATPTMLAWQGNGPWLRTVVRKTPVEHDFPAKHMDVLEQVVEYRVPLNFFTPLATFNGSVVPSRTRGELSAQGDREAANILALNLADDIVQGRAKPDQARTAMAAGVRDLDAGRTPEAAAKLHILRQQGDTSDPDTAVVSPP